MPALDSVEIPIQDGETLTVTGYKPVFRHSDDPVALVEVLSTRYSRGADYLTPAQARTLAAALLAQAEAAEKVQAEYDADRAL